MTEGVPRSHFLMSGRRTCGFMCRVFRPGLLNVKVLPKVSAGSTTIVETVPMILTALQECGREHGVSSNASNDEHGQDCRPSLHPDPRGFGGQNVEEHEDQGSVPKYVFDSDQTVRAMRSWGEYRCPGNILH